MSYKGQPLGYWGIAIGMVIIVGYFIAVGVAQAFPGGLDWSPITEFTINWGG